MKNTTPTTPTTSATPRVINPAIAKLREEHKARVAELKFNENSDKVLTRIVEQDLPKLTGSALGYLKDRLIAKMDVTEIEKPFKPTTGGDGK